MKISTSQDIASIVKFQEGLNRYNQELCQQRSRMTRYRLARKKELVTSREKRQLLEKTLQQLLASNHQRDLPPPKSVIAALHQLSIEQISLTRENILLRDAIEHKITLESKMKRETDKFLDEVLATPKAMATVVQDNRGCWVNFLGGEPPFYFTPLTETEYIDKRKLCEVEFADRNPCSTTIGNLFGWRVDYVQPIRQESGPTIAYARFSKRMRCSLDETFKVLLKTSPNQWPVIVSQRSWGRTQRGDIYCQPLQKFSESNLVMICNVPGDVHLRYLALGQYSFKVHPNGKRVLTHSIWIVDSEENARNREAEGPQQEVQWVRFGGEVCVFTEVDENTIDVVYDHWAECLTEAHGRQLYIDWIQFAIRLEQFISPTRLLTV